MFGFDLYGQCQAPLGELVFECGAGKPPSAKFTQKDQKPSAKFTQKGGDEMLGNNRKTKEKYNFSLAIGYARDDKEIERIKDYGKEYRYIIDEIYIETPREMLSERFKSKPKYLICVSPIAEGKEKGYIEYGLMLRGLEIIYIDGSEVDETARYYAEREKETRIERMTAGRERRAKAGLYSHGRCPYGYYYENGKLYMDSYEAFVVKFCYLRRKQGCSYYMIAKELNQRGFQNRNGTSFFPKSISSMIERKSFYQGKINYHGEEIKGVHTPILSEDEECLWGKIFEENILSEEEEAKLKRYKDKFGRSTGRPAKLKPFIVYEETDKEGIRRRKLQR